MFGLLNKDVFGRNIILKKLIVQSFGLFFYPRFNWKYDSQITGAEIIEKLPATNVLFIANHQTYFADVAFMFQVLQNARLGFFNNIRKMGFWKLPIRNLFFVAAKDTMEAGLIPKLMALAGAVTVKRTWREKGKEINREVDQSDISNIGKALANGWVISFPQGTTSPYADVRKGTAYIIKEYQPTVIPIVLDGFRRAFDKKGLKKKKKYICLKMRIKEPLKINYSDSIDKLVQQIANSIEQSKDFKDNSSKIVFTN